MKKIISLLLALLMAFSVVTVAFATEDGSADQTTTAAPAGENEEEGAESVIDLGEYQWILDLPFWTVKPALKFAKIAFKLVSVYLKVGKIFGVVEQDMDDIILGLIEDLIEDSMKGENTEETTTAAAAEAA